MEALLATLGVQTVNYAIRSGIALTSKYAVQQCSRLLKTVNDKAVRTELKALQKLLDSKIKVRFLNSLDAVGYRLNARLQQILSPALDLIEFKYGKPPTMHFLMVAGYDANALHSHSQVWPRKHLSRVRSTPRQITPSRHCPSREASGKCRHRRGGRLRRRAQSPHVGSPPRRVAAHTQRHQASP